MIKAVDIKWDADNADDLIGLPTEVEIPPEILQECEEDDEAISDYLTDFTGFCHCGYRLQEDQ